MPAVKQKRSKLADTSSRALPTAPAFAGGKAVSVVLCLFHGVAFLCGISTPSLQAQGEQRCFFLFNIPSGHSHSGSIWGLWHVTDVARYDVTDLARDLHCSLLNRGSVCYDQI
jgi:hypothetical protein